MRFNTSLTIFYIFFYHLEIPAAVRHEIQGTETKQAIDLIIIHSLMAGIIVTGSVFKKAVTILHIFSPDNVYFLLNKHAIHSK